MMKSTMKFVQDGIIPASHEAQMMAQMAADAFVIRRIVEQKRVDRYVSLQSPAFKVAIFDIKHMGKKGGEA